MRKTTPLGKASSMSQLGGGNVCSGIIFTQSLELLSVGVGLSVTPEQSELFAKRLRQA